MWKKKLLIELGIHSFEYLFIMNQSIIRNMYEIASKCFNNFNSIVKAEIHHALIRELPKISKRTFHFKQWLLFICVDIHHLFKYWNPHYLFIERWVQLGTHNCYSLFWHQSLKIWWMNKFCINCINIEIW